MHLGVTSDLIPYFVVTQRLQRSTVLGYDRFSAWGLEYTTQNRATLEPLGILEPDEEIPGYKTRQGLDSHSELYMNPEVSESGSYTTKKRQEAMFCCCQLSRSWKTRARPSRPTVLELSFRSHSETPSFLSAKTWRSALGCLLAGCLDFDFLGVYGPYSMKASSSTCWRRPEDS